MMDSPFSMKSLLSRGVFIGLCFTLFQAQAFAKECTLRVGWEAWPPYMEKKADGTMTGIDGEVAQKVLTSIGCKIIWKEVVWKRHLLQMKAGDLDVALGASKTPDREKWGYFSRKPYRQETMALFVRKGEAPNFAISNIDDLSKLIGASKFKLGITLGYFYGDAFEAIKKQKSLKKGIKIANVDAKHYDYLTQKPKQIDGFFGDKYATVAGLKDKKMNGAVEVHKYTVNNNDIFMLFSKKSVPAETVNKASQAIEKMENTDIKEILNKYSLQ